MWSRTRHVNQQVYLGLEFVTSDLSWGPHIQKITSKASRNLNMIRRNISNSMGQLDCLSVGETWDVPFTWPGTLKKIINQGANGPLLCSALATKWWAIPGHPGSPASPIKEKSDPPGRRGLEREVQSILPNDCR